MKLMKSLARPVGSPLVAILNGRDSFGAVHLDSLYGIVQSAERDVADGLLVACNAGQHDIGLVCDFRVCGGVVDLFAVSGLFLDAGQLDEIVETSLRRAAIWDETKDSLNKSALSMSGGQQQRICITRALAADPEVLLMDEPTSALDPISTAKIEDLVLELKKDYTIVMVTHNMQQATRVSDTTAFFLLGDMIEADDTEKLFSTPRDKRTEDYITGRFG